MKNVGNVAKKIKNKKKGKNSRNCEFGFPL